MPQLRVTTSPSTVPTSTSRPNYVRSVQNSSQPTSPGQLCITKPLHLPWGPAAQKRELSDSRSALALSYDQLLNEGGITERLVPRTGLCCVQVLADRLEVV